MLKPNMPNIPGMGTMNDTLEFVKNLWGGMGVPGMNVPGMVIPTLSVEEIRKKISDLKAVEAWLELNMNMLRGTIQALEVQAATISTLQTMGEALNATVSASTGNIYQSQAAQQPPARQPSPPPPPPRATHRASDAPAPTSRDEADAATLTAPLVNAAAWWNMLQDQFKHAVDTAMATEMPEAGGADRAAVKQKAKPEKEAAPTSARKRKPSK